VVRELKKGRQKVQFGISASDGTTAVDDEDGAQNSTQAPDVKQVFETR